MRPYWNPLNSADELADTTDARPGAQWFTGVGMAVLIAAYAIDCLVAGEATLPLRRFGGFYHCYGLSATALGCLYLCIALFVHLHWFWTASPRLWGYAQLGKMIAALGMIASVVVFFFAELAA